MRDAYELLRLLTARFPPTGNRRHAIALTDTGQLFVALAVDDGKWRPFTLDEEDLASSGESVAASIELLMAGGSIAPGQSGANAGDELSGR